MGASASTDGAAWPANYNAVLDLIRVGVAFNGDGGLFILETPLRPSQGPRKGVFLSRNCWMLSVQDQR
jgi:hypothetical protein